MITEFIVYVTKNNVSFNTNIQLSIYETNSFILNIPKKNKPKSVFELYSSKNDGLTLIEYATFFGSIQIFKYMLINGAKLTSSLWPLAIHSKNAEIIHILEDNHVELEDKTYRQVFYESIKCHHNDIANYFLTNFLQRDDENSQETIDQSLKYYNFAFLKNDEINESSFCNLCKYEYCALVDNLLNSKDIDVNKLEIYNILLI